MDASPLTTFLSNNTKIFYLAVGLSSDTGGANFFFKQHFDSIIDPLLNRRTTTYNIFFNPLTPMI